MNKSKIDTKYESLFRYLDGLYYGDPSEDIANLEKQQAIHQMMNNVRFLSLAGVRFLGIRTGAQLIKDDPRLATFKGSNMIFHRQIKPTDLFLDVAFKPTGSSSQGFLKSMDLVGTALGYNKAGCFEDRYFIINELTKNEMFDDKSTEFFHNTAKALGLAKEYWEVSCRGTLFGINKYIDQVFGDNTEKNALTIDFLRRTYERFNGWEMSWTETAMFESLEQLMNQDMKFRSYTTPNTRYVDSKVEAIESVRYNINNSVNSMIDSGIISRHPEDVGVINITEDTPYDEVMKVAIGYALEDVSESIVMQPYDVPTV